jgi:protein-L-isoaspartate(D-aspartate) O-methyltransferase
MAFDLAERRERMVAEQLQQRGITQRRVLAAMRAVPRERFVAPELAQHAYDDTPLPIGEGQTISQPYMVALMCEVAELEGDERVLEIGTGSGYGTAVLAHLAREVYSIERIQDLHTSAGPVLATLGLTNCRLMCADGSEGWPEAAPFETIVVAAAMPGLPRPLLEQLTPDGRLIAPVGEYELQTLVRISRRNGRWQEEYFGECRFVKLLGKHGFREL